MLMYLIVWSSFSSFVPRHGMWWRSHIGHEGKGGVRYSWLTYTSLSKMNGG
uniref:Uncharacterized protein n=1 Tax=Medicago truncatula TaxID=3880 RepID=Q2HSF2_MEDTR|nr:hypothetical protein MtrDRAFT_AC151523g7v2 [Medicago truncatula]